MSETATGGPEHVYLCDNYRVGVDPCTVFLCGEEGVEDGQADA